MNFFQRVWRGVTGQTEREIGAHEVTISALRDTIRRREQEKDGRRMQLEERLATLQQESFDRGAQIRQTFKDLIDEAKKKAETPP